MARKRTSKRSNGESLVYLFGAGLAGLAIISFWYISIPIVIFILFSRTNYGKGVLGELSVRRIIGSNKPKKDYYVVNNITFDDGEKSAQIDHIIINRSGLIVIETKNRIGKIFGKESDLNWTAVYNYGKKKATFFNPIKQNEGHLKSLRKILDNDLEMHSIIVFTKSADIREIHTETVPVVYANSLKQFIKDYQYSNDSLTTEEVIEVYQKLVEIKKNNKITNKEHVNAINERIESRKSKRKES